MRKIIRSKDNWLFLSINAFFISSLFFSILLVLFTSNNSDKVKYYSNYNSFSNSETLDYSEVGETKNGNIYDFYVDSGPTLDSLEVHYNTDAQLERENIEIKIEHYNDAGEILDRNIDSSNLLFEKIERTNEDSDNLYNGAYGNDWFNPYNFSNSITEDNLSPVYDWKYIDKNLKYEFISSIKDFENSDFSFGWYWSIIDYPSYWNDISLNEKNETLSSFFTTNNTENTLEGKLEENNSFYINFLQPNTTYKIYLRDKDYPNDIVYDVVETNDYISNKNIKSDNGNEFNINFDVYIESWSNSWINFQNTYYDYTEFNIENTSNFYYFENSLDSNAKPSYFPSESAINNWTDFSEFDVYISELFSNSDLNENRIKYEFSYNDQDEVNNQVDFKISKDVLSNIQDPRDLSKTIEFNFSYLNSNRLSADKGDYCYTSYPLTFSIIEDPELFIKESDSFISADSSLLDLSVVFESYKNSELDIPYEVQYRAYTKDQKYKKDSISFETLYYNNGYESNNKTIEIDNYFNDDYYIDTRIVIDDFAIDSTYNESMLVSYSDMPKIKFLTEEYNPQSDSNGEYIHFEFEIESSDYHYSELEIMLSNNYGYESEWVNFSDNADIYRDGKRASDFSKSGKYYVDLPTNSFDSLENGTYTYVIRGKVVNEQGKKLSSDGGWVYYDISNSYYRDNSSDGKFEIYSNYSANINSLDYIFSDSDELLFSLNFDSWDPINSARLISVDFEIVNSNNDVMSFSFIFSFDENVASGSEEAESVELYDADGNIVGEVNLAMSNMDPITMQGDIQLLITFTDPNYFFIDYDSFSILNTEFSDGVDPSISSGATYEFTGNVQSNKPVIITNANVNYGGSDSMSNINDDIRIELDLNDSTINSSSIRASYEIIKKEGPGPEIPPSSQNNIVSISSGSGSYYFLIDDLSNYLAYGTTYTINITLEYKESKANDSSISHNVMPTTDDNSYISVPSKEYTSELKTIEFHYSLEPGYDENEVYVQSIFMNPTIVLQSGVNAILDYEFLVKEGSVTVYSISENDISDEYFNNKSFLVEKLEGGKKYEITLTANLSFYNENGDNYTFEEDLLSYNFVHNFTTKKEPYVEIKSIILYDTNFTIEYNEYNFSGIINASTDINNSAGNNLSTNRNSSFSCTLDISRDYKVTWYEHNNKEIQKSYNISYNLNYNEPLIGISNVGSKYVDSFYFDLTYSSSNFDDAQLKMPSDNSIYSENFSFDVSNYSLDISSLKITINEITVSGTTSNWIERVYFDGYEYDFNNGGIKINVADSNTSFTKRVDIYVNRNLLNDRVVNTNNLRFSVGIEFVDSNGVFSDVKIDSFVNLHDMPSFNIGNKVSIGTGEESLDEYEGTTSEYATLNLVHFYYEGDIPEFDVYYKFGSHDNGPESVNNSILDWHEDVADTNANNEVQQNRVTSLKFSWGPSEGDSSWYDEVSNNGVYLYVKFTFNGDSSIHNPNSSTEYAFKYDNKRTTDKNEYYYQFSNKITIGIESPFFDYLRILESKTTSNSLTFEYKISIPDKYNISTGDVDFTLYPSDESPAYCSSNPGECSTVSRNRFNSNEVVITFNNLKPDTKYELYIELTYREIINDSPSDSERKVYLDTRNAYDDTNIDDSGDGNKHTITYDTWPEFISSIDVTMADNNVYIEINFYETIRSTDIPKFYSVVVYTSAPGGTGDVIYNEDTYQDLIPVEDNIYQIPNLENGTYWLQVITYSGNIVDGKNEVTSVQAFGNKNDPILDVSYQSSMPTWQKAVISASVSFVFLLIVAIAVYRLRFYSPDALGKVSDSLSDAVLTEAVYDDGYDSSDTIKSNTTVRKTLLFGLISYEKTEKLKNILYVENYKAAKKLSKYTVRRHNLYDNFSLKESQGINSIFEVNESYYGIKIDSERLNDLADKNHGEDSIVDEIKSKRVLEVNTYDVNMDQVVVTTKDSNDISINVLTTDGKIREKHSKNGTHRDIKFNNISKKPVNKVSSAAKSITENFSSKADYISKKHLNENISKKEEMIKSLEGVPYENNRAGLDLTNSIDIISKKNNDISHEGFSDDEGYSRKVNSSKKDK